jgi:S4 domain protein YaaA
MNAEGENMKKFKISSDFITLGQFLKATDYIGSGGEAKFFLLQQEVFVNHERRTERGKKLYHGDQVMIFETVHYIVNDTKHTS